MNYDLYVNSNEVKIVLILFNKFAGVIFFS